VAGVTPMQYCPTNSTQVARHSGVGVRVRYPVAVSPFCIGRLKVPTNASSGLFLSVWDQLIAPASSASTAAFAFTFALEFSGEAGS
jgi:hypothetical protein